MLYSRVNVLPSCLVQGVKVVAFKQRQLTSMSLSRMIVSGSSTNAVSVNDCEKDTY